MPQAFHNLQALSWATVKAGWVRREGSHCCFSMPCYTEADGGAAAGSATGNGKAVRKTALAMQGWNLHFTVCCVMAVVKIDEAKKEKETGRRKRQGTAPQFSWTHP